MSSHGYGQHDLGGGFAHMLVLLLLVLLVVAVITIVLIVRSIVYIIVTFAKFRKHTTLVWRSFWVFALSVAFCAALIIYAQTVSPSAPGQPALVSILLTLLYLSPVIGYLQLLICCKVVRTEFSENVMKQNYDVMSDILRKDWWQSSEDRPLTQQQAA